MQLPDDQLLEVSSHSLTSAGGRSWVLPVPGLGAGLWQSATSWYPIGGSKCHHDVSQKYILPFPFFNILKRRWVCHVSQHMTSAKAHSRTSNCFVKARFKCFSCGERKRCTVSLLTWCARRLTMQEYAGTSGLQPDTPGKSLCSKYVWVDLLLENYSWCVLEWFYLFISQCRIDYTFNDHFVTYTLLVKRYCLT